MTILNVLKYYCDDFTIFPKNSRVDIDEYCSVALTEGLIKLVEDFDPYTNIVLNINKKPSINYSLVLH